MLSKMLARNRRDSQRNKEGGKKEEGESKLFLRDFFFLF